MCASGNHLEHLISRQPFCVTAYHKVPAGPDGMYVGPAWDVRYIWSTQSVNSGIPATQTHMLLLVVDYYMLHAVRYIWSMHAVTYQQPTLSRNLVTELSCWSTAEKVTISLILIWKTPMILSLSVGRFYTSAIYNFIKTYCLQDLNHTYNHFVAW